MDLKRHILKLCFVLFLVMFSTWMSFSDNARNISILPVVCVYAQANWRLLCVRPTCVCACSTMTTWCCPNVLPDGISVTGLPISSPLRHVLKPRAEKSGGTEGGKTEYSHIKVKTHPYPGGKPSWYTLASYKAPLG